MNILPENEAELIEPLVGTTMLELGNKSNVHGTYKSYFTSLGIHHTSVDINGMDGAIPLDLQEPLMLGKFDMVTNFGTSEHVANQEPCWRNIIEATGKLLVCVTPAPGGWIKPHGRWYPSQDFYVALAQLNGFKIERLYQMSLSSKRAVICVRMMRVMETPFVMPDQSLIIDQGDYGVGVAFA